MMDKCEWDKLAVKVKNITITPFELGLLIGLASKYDFRDMEQIVMPPLKKDKKTVAG